MVSGQATDFLAFLANAVDYAFREGSAAVEVIRYYVPRYLCSKSSITGQARQGTAHERCTMYAP